MTKLRLSLYQPEIPQNTGSLIRLSACLEIPIDIIEPCNFLFSEQKLKRSSMDYINYTNITIHENWKMFVKQIKKSSNKNRIIAVDIKGNNSIENFLFKKDDILLMGKESIGLPKIILSDVDLIIRIPMKKNLRSLNLAISASIIIGIAMKQLSEFPKEN